MYAKNPRRNFQRLFDQINAMQEQMAFLSETVHTLANNSSSANAQRSDAIPQPSNGHRSFRSLSSAKELAFQGPTTFAFSVDIAKSSLQRRGIVEQNEVGDGNMTQEPSPMPSPPPPDPSWKLAGRATRSGILGRLKHYDSVMCMKRRWEL